jgi:hypothetical protein
VKLFFNFWSAECSLGTTQNTHQDETRVALFL